MFVIFNVCVLHLCDCANFHGFFLKRRQGPSAISHSIASSKEVNTLTRKPLFWAQSAKNPTRSNRSRGQRRAVFRENALPSLLSWAARYQRSDEDILDCAFRVSISIPQSAEVAAADAMSVNSFFMFSRSSRPFGVAFMKACVWIILISASIVPSSCFF